MLKSKIPSGKYLPAIFLWLGFLMLAMIALVFLSYSKTTDYTSRASRVQRLKQAHRYYTPQAYHLPKEMTDKTGELLNSANNLATSSIELPILLYHYIEPLKPGDRLRDSLTVTPEKLGEQLNLIKQSGWQTIFMSQAVARLKNPLSQKNQIALTFDDGYRDFYEYAFPLLKQSNLKATIYVIYDTINAPDYLTEAMIKEMLASGLVEIGSHTLDHKQLTAIPAAEAKRQISLSKKMLEERFKIPMITFAYPYGSFDQTLIDQVKAAGYSAAVSVVAGDEQSDANRFFLYRLRSTNNYGSQLIKSLLFDSYLPLKKP